MPPESRNTKRTERYRELRALGFSATDARKLRDRSGTNIQKSIAVEQRRISRKPIQLRSSQEQFRLVRIRNYRISADNIYRQSRVDSRRERWDKFSGWSKTNNFPNRYRNRIRQINKRAGKTALDGYGFRRFYFEYVERLSIEDSLQFSDRGDSGVRYLRNKPLVPGRINLRRTVNPPKSQSGAA